MVPAVQSQIGGVVAQPMPGRWPWKGEAGWGLEL